MTADDLLTIFFVPPAPSKSDFIHEAAQKISNYFDFEEETVETLLIECHEQVISDISKVYTASLAWSTAERPLDDTLDVYHRAEKVGNHFTYNIYLKSAPDDEGLTEITHVKGWTELLPEPEVKH